MTKEIQLKNIENIKKAIEVEAKHRYINIVGKKNAFSQFIILELKQILKNNKKNKKGKLVIKAFEHYQFDSVSQRMETINKLIDFLKNPDELIIENKVKVVEKAKDKSNLTEVMYVKGVGPKVANLLNKVGIYTAEDLLHYFPRKYLDYSQRTPIKDIEVGQNVSVFGTIKSVNAFQSKKRAGLTILSIAVSDGTGTISASWFYGKANRVMLERYKSQFPKGGSIILSGVAKFDEYNASLAIDKPEHTIVTGDFEENSTRLHLNRIVPVYPLTERLNAKVLRRAIFNAVENFAPQIEEFLPIHILKKLNLLDKPNAIKQIHFPEDEDVLAKARERLVFEELFLIQLRMALLRQENKKIQKGASIEIKKGGLVEQFVKSLPFELTGGQKKAFEEISLDLNSKEPMQRLLQGDVGSGKTVVAAMTLLAAIENGYQAAIMAPTEILAEQHYKNFVDWLTPLGLSVGLFVGKHGVKIRKEMHQNLKNGQINIAIGTHALIQEGVEFANLGAVVIDEQHRFGVKQRTKLKGKGNACEMLTMTATPIPRTLALTVHGDLDITLIDELPKGRKPIKTLLISSGARKKAYELIDRELQKGQQAYVVFPLIEESESLSAKAATKEAEKLAKKIFPQYKIGLVHGKLKPLEKDKVMNEFRNKKYDILVSTTVIEVGVDVPNATVMLIENAERFGLSQLHQLRGRVGRSDLQSYCILATDSKTPQTVDRLSIMTKTNNGFIIAEKDMEIRGPGEFMGTRQSGLPDLLLADITKDVEMLEKARKYAFEFVDSKKIKDYPNLNKKMKNKVLEGIELIASG